MSGRSILAVAIRAQTAAIIVMQGGRIIEVVRRRGDHAPHGVEARAFIASTVCAMAHDYAVGTVIVEPRTPLRSALDDERFTVVAVDLRRAAIALGIAADATIGNILDEVIAIYPRLRRFMFMLRDGGIGHCDRRRTVILIDTALGLGYHRTIVTRACRDEVR